MIYNGLYDLEGFLRINTLNDLKTKKFHFKENDLIFITENFTFYKIQLNDNQLDNNNIEIDSKLKCKKILTIIDKNEVVEKIQELNNKKSDEIDLPSSDNLATSMAIKKINDIVSTKEPKITKNSGFNLNKSNDYKINDIDSLLTTNGAYTLYQNLLEIINSLCPYQVGDVYVTTRNDNPSNIWKGTSWQKIEGRFLKGTNYQENTKTLGGSNTKTLTVANIPTHSHSINIVANGNHTHSQASHTHTQPAHVHYLKERLMGVLGDYNRSYFGIDSDGKVKNLKTEPAGGENTGAAQPTIYASGNHSHNASIGNTGSGSAFDITPLYYSVNMWLRIK